MAIVFSNILVAAEQGEGIDKAFHVKSAGTNLYLKVRGQDTGNPVLLYLHGGPGEANGPLLFQAYAGPELEKHFIVGYLHQRNTCMSPVAPDSTLTIRHFIEDIDRVVSFLREEFKKDKIFLLGHSFGGGLGYLYLLEHADNIEKFVSAGGAFSTSGIEENGYQTTMTLAEQAENQEAVKKLTDLGPPPYKTFGEGIVWRMIAMNLLNNMNEGIARNLEMEKVMAVTGIESVDPAWMKKSMTIANTMWSELGTINLEEKVKNIGVPMLIIAGARDIMVPFSILEKGYGNYGGEKEYLILENSNHMMFIDEPGPFVSKVIEYFRK
jgi:pimeloyl-ACP methyl ester carboxylesterase